MPESIPFSSSFFHVTHHEGVHVVSIIRDQLTEEDNLEQFALDYSRLIEKHSVQRIVLIMKQVRYMSSSAIGKIITLHRRLNRSEGTLVLAELTTGVESILQTSRLLEYFKSAPDQEAALMLARSCVSVDPVE